jgi:hypothetical protein
MIDHLLTDGEVELVIEVLDAEHKRLLPEVRHTDSRVLRRQLVGRARALERIVERLKTREMETHTPTA